MFRCFAYYFIYILNLQINFCAIKLQTNNFFFNKYEINIFMHSIIKLYFIYKNN